MEKLELVVNSQQGIITFNFDELKAALEAKMQDYTNVVYTAETVKTGKKDVAELRKLYKSLDEKRKEIKKTWNDPYKQFEDKVKELQEIINKPINEINEQIEVFEQQKIAEKKAKIQSTYDEVFAGLEEYAPLNKIYDPKWENSTTSMKSIRERMVTLQTAVSNSISTINNMKSDAVEDALEIYKNTGDLATALAHITQYENQKAEILEKQRIKDEERQRKAEEERIRKEEQERQAKAEAKANNEKMVKEMLQDNQSISQPVGFGVPTSQQGFDSEVPPTNQGFDGFVTSSEPQPPQEQTGFAQVQGFGGFAQPEQSPVNDTQPVQGFGVKQEEPKKVVFTVRVSHEMANHFEGLITQWGYTDFDRR